MSALAKLHALFPAIAHGSDESAHAKPLRLSSGSPSGALTRLDDLLPDGGLPRGAVIELTSAHGLARATSIALRACAAAQADARLRTGDVRTVGAWCAFIDPWGTLHAPGVAASGVDLERLLVVRSPEGALARVAVRVAESRAFSVVVVDTVGVPGSELSASSSGASRGDVVRLDRWGTVVRRLALAIERTDTTVLLVTDAAAARSMPLPVALRLELERRGDGPTIARVAKERHGRVGAPVAVAV